MYQSAKITLSVLNSLRIFICTKDIFQVNIQRLTILINLHWIIFSIHGAETLLTLFLKNQLVEEYNKYDSSYRIL